MQENQNLDTVGLIIERCDVISGQRRSLGSSWSPALFASLDAKGGSWTGGESCFGWSSFLFAYTHTHTRWVIVDLSYSVLVCSKKIMAGTKLTSYHLLYVVYYYEI